MKNTIADFFIFGQIIFLSFFPQPKEEIQKK